MLGTGQHRGCRTRKLQRWHRRRAGREGCPRCRLWDGEEGEVPVPAQRPRYLFEDLKQGNAAGVGAVDDALRVPEAEAHHSRMDHRGGDAAYNIHVNGVLHCRVRYSQLLGLHEQLRKEYGANVVPAFPPKKIFTLTPAEVEQRREQLEKYMQAGEPPCPTAVLHGASGPTATRGTARAPLPRPRCPRPISAPRPRLPRLPRPVLTQP
uniref:PX domain-containing protein n=1 Tax=Nothoprocta perdicaria TaxID=30464 RepID=A0A8C7A036_NOTPE